jgi:hypothetical protein
MLVLCVGKQVGNIVPVKIIKAVAGMFYVVQVYPLPLFKSICA